MFKSTKRNRKNRKSVMHEGLYAKKAFIGRKVSALSCLLFMGMLAVVLSGCPQKGRLELMLDVPTDEDLNPLTNSALKEVRMQVHRGGSIDVETVVWNEERQTLDLGEVGPGPVDAISLSGYSIDGRLLSYGRTGSFDVPDGGGFNVLLPFRRPLTYISGLEGAMQVFDTSLRNEKQILPPLLVDSDNPGAGTTYAASSTPDGRHILLITHDPHKLIVVDTRDHTVKRTHTLDFKPYHMGISRDGRWVVAADPGEPNIRDGTLMVAGLNQVINNPDHSPITIGGLGDFPPAGRPAFMTLSDGRERVVMVGKRAPFNFDCTEEASVIHFIDPYTGQMDPPLVLYSTARAVAASPKSDYFFVAMPCDGTVLVVDPNNRDIQELFVENPMDMAVSSPFESTSYLYVGNVTKEGHNGAPAKLSVTTIELDDHQFETIEVSFFSETILVRSESDGTKVTLTLEPRELRIWGMSLPPGEQKLSLLVYAIYEHGYISLGDDSLDARSISTDTYVTLDMNSGEIGGRYRTNCTDHNTGVPIPSAEGCLTLPEGQEPLVPFFPWGITSIYGSQ